MRKLNFLEVYKLRRIYKQLLKVPKDDIETSKIFIDGFYRTSNLPDNLYRIFIYEVQGEDYEKIFSILLTRNIYDLICFLKNEEPLKNIEELINPTDYFSLSNKQIKYIVEQIKQLGINNEIELKKKVSKKTQWILRRPCTHNEIESTKIAIKMYISIGLDNSIDLLKDKYGVVDYDIIYYLFNNLDTKDKNYNEIFREFLFGNKKDPSNNMRLILEGELQELFINFDYFYNSLEYFIEKLGKELNRSKVLILLRERFLAPDIEYPEISGDILDDMISSYHNKYGIYESDSEIIDINLNAYTTKLKTKTKSSIIKTDIPKDGEYTFEILPLDDVRNLVMGYRSGNCFRINGDAFIFFKLFLNSPHMRILSISTEEYKDFGMVLLMRNGNTLIAQGIELSKRTPYRLTGEKLYNAVKKTIEHIMQQMNNDGDEIVASVIGLTNDNTKPYNDDVLPFRINPTMDDEHKDYDAIYTCQGLLSLQEGKSKEDIKAYTPTKYYYDDSTIYRRDINNYGSEYRKVEKILQSLRFARFKTGNKDEIRKFYLELPIKREIYTLCTLDWYITVYHDGTIDSFINSTNPREIEKYNLELEKARISSKKYSLRGSRLWRR